MKHNTLLLFILTFCGSIYSQEHNPFKSIGKPGNIITLSKGRYTEIHVNDTLQKIGSVVVNTKTGTIYELLNTDTLYSESNLDPTVISRWYSPDPMVKHHESPYASMANNPILCVDPNGADSALAAGGSTWQWKAESGDTYNSISRRTGVPVGDLRYFNQDAIKDDRQIPTGSILNLSDPSCRATKFAADIAIPEGNISVLFFDEHGPWNEISLLFTPNANTNGSDYIWFQTFQTNDPKQYNAAGEVQKLAPERLLSPTMTQGNDIDQGYRWFKSQKIFPFPNGKTVYPKGTDVGFYDHPNRPNINSGTIQWSGTLSLCRKVNSEYVIYKTFTYMWTQTGSDNVLEELIYSDDGGGNIQSQQQLLDAFNQK